MATLAVFGNALPIAAMALGAPLAVIVPAALVNGAAMELFGVFWYTALHEHVAPEALSRVSAYDALGSMVLSPLGWWSPAPSPMRSA